MAEPRVILELEDRLRRHGLGRARLERILGEVRSHWEEARAEALREGWSEPTAVERAGERLGGAEILARAFAEQLRRSSWLGRHPWLGLAVLPTLLFALHGLVLSFPVRGLWALGDRLEADFWRHEPFTQVGAGVLWASYVLTTALVPATLSWWSWRAGLGMRFLWLVQAGCLAAALFRWFQVDTVHRTVSFFMRTTPQLDAHTLLVFAVHLAVVALVMAWIRHSGIAFRWSRECSSSPSYEN